MKTPEEIKEEAVKEVLHQTEMYKQDLIDRAIGMEEFAKNHFGSDFKGAKIVLDSFKMHIEEYYKKRFITNK